MNTFRVIQNVLIAVGIITTVSLVDGIEVSASNVQAAFVIACFTIVTILEREFRSEKTKSKTSMQARNFPYSG
jgi:hypothetical protein